MRLSLILMVALVCAGCGRERASGKYGNFAKVESVDLMQDATAQLYALWPPAKTRFNMLQETKTDAFGAELVNTLRASGYAVSEFSPRAVRRTREWIDDRVTDTAPGYDLGYVIDEQDSELRLTLFVGQEAISRMYMIVKSNTGTISYSPLGYWSRRR
jgi:hypothetical protein